MKVLRNGQQVEFSLIEGTLVQETVFHSQAGIEMQVKNFLLPLGDDRIMVVASSPGLARQMVRTHVAEQEAAAKSEAEALAARPLPGTESLARSTDLDARIEVMQDRLAIAVDYATMFRTADDAESVEACEKAIRQANMLSQAILAMNVRRTS
jgi:hypothetical protein